jgi:hypothetical protein
MKHYKNEDGYVLHFSDGMAAPEGYTEISHAQWMLANGSTQAEVDAYEMNQAIAAIQHRLDAFAQTRGYDSILSACTYATSAVPRFAAEGQCAVASRDGTWAVAAQIFAEVQAGTRTAPTEAELLAELPVLVWPA